MQIFSDKYPLHRIGLGAMPLSVGNRPSEAQAIKVIHTFIEMGGNFIDTADVYGLDDTDRGHNERLIHKALKKLRHQSNVLVSTKGGATRPDGGWGLRGGHPNKIRKACEQSLTNLNITQHTLYYLHGPDPDVPLEDSLGEIIRLKEEGKIMYIGIANVDLMELKLAMSLTPIAVLQNRCNPFCKGDLNNGVIEYCKINDIVYVPYCPLGGWMFHKELAEHSLYKYFVSKYQVSSYLISLAWLIAKGDHIVPIPGMDRANYVTMNFKAMDIALESEDIKQIDRFPNFYLPKHVEA